MSKILIIGVGGGGINAVIRMKKEGIPNANFIGIDFDRKVSEEQNAIPYYDLREKLGLYNYSFSYNDHIRIRRFAENVEKEIGEIIDKHLNEEPI